MRIDYEELPHRIDARFHKDAEQKNSIATAARIRNGSKGFYMLGDIVKPVKKWDGNFVLLLHYKEVLTLIAALSKISAHFPEGLRDGRTSLRIHHG